MWKYVYFIQLTFNMSFFLMRHNVLESSILLIIALNFGSVL